MQRKYKNEENFNNNCFLLLVVLTACNNQESKNNKDKIIIYGDFKCPYCKQLEEEIVPKLKRIY